MYKYMLGLRNRQPQLRVSGMSYRINTEEAQVLAAKLRCSAVTVLNNYFDVLPLAPVEGDIAVLSIGEKEADAPFVEAMKKNAGISHFHLPWNADEALWQDVQGQLAAFRRVVISITGSAYVSDRDVAFLEDETESLGGQCVNPEFTSQYQGAAPFTLAGKSYTVTDPVTGAAYAAAGAAEEQPAAAGDFDPAQWRTFDTSPEAEATRKMYAAGLTLSALKGEALGDELAPPLDSSAEAVARRKLYAAMLSKSALDGEPMAIPFADLSAEEQSKARLEQASLTTAGNASGAVSADLTEVDALSGATITSSAVTTIVNNSYFYVTGVLCAE